MGTELLLDNVDKNRDEWLKLKQRKVSSSNIAAIAGLSKWRSPLEVWAEWTGKVQDTFQGNLSTRLGNLLEPFVADLYAAKTGRRLRRANALYGNQDYPWAVVSPDYFETCDNGLEGVLEIKTGNNRQRERWQGGNCPEEYIAQLQFQLGILGYDRGTLTAFLGLDTEEDYTYEFAFDPEMFVLLVEKAEEFLDLVKRDVPPEAGPGDGHLIRDIVRRKKATRRLIGEEADRADELLMQLRALQVKSSPLKEQLNQLEVERKTAENRLKLLLGANATVELPDGRIVSVKTISVGEKVTKGYSFEKLALPKDH